MESARALPKEYIAMNLLDTPPEMFYQILGYLYHPADRSNLSRSCRNLHRLIQPMLYAEFVASTSKVAFLFIRTISSNSSLALLVQRLVLAITYPNLDCHVPFEFAPELVEEDWSSLKQKLKAYCAARDELASGYAVSWAEPFIDAAATEFFRNLTYQRTDDISACLLLLLSNLKSIVATSRGGNGTACTKVLQMARTLQVRNNRGIQGPNASDFTLSKLRESVGFTGTFELPSMQKFDSNLPMNIPPDLKNCVHEVQITELTLRSSGMPSTDMGQILKKCFHLEHLHLSFRYPSYCAFNPRKQFDPAIFFQSIVHLNKKLRSLALIELDSPTGNNPYTQGVQLFNAPIGTFLSQFSKLQRLEISRDFLFGKGTYSELELAYRCEGLPASLTHLTLFDSVDRMTAAQKIIHSPFELAAISHQKLVSKNFKKYGVALSYTFDKRVRSGS